MFTCSVSIMNLLRSSFNVTQHNDKTTPHNNVVTVHFEKNSKTSRQNFKTKKKKGYIRKLWLSIFLLLARSLILKHLRLIGCRPIRGVTVLARPRTGGSVG